MKTINAGFFKGAAALGMLVIAMGNVGAAAVTYGTSPGTQFLSGGLSLNSSLGAAATLAFTPTSFTSVGTPSNVNYGMFSLICASCTTQATGGGAVFSAFTFDLYITELDEDLNTKATGRFRGTANGGTVFSDVSPITITWVPLVLGPGTTNAISGNFGATTFIIDNATFIVAPNSGAAPGQSTVEGAVNGQGSEPTAETIPEPGTMALFGAGFLAVGIVLRKK